MDQIVTDAVISAQQEKWHKKNRKLVVIGNDYVSVRIYFNKDRYEAMWFRIVYSDPDNRVFVGVLENVPLIARMDVGDELQFERLEIIDLKRSKNKQIR